MLTLVRNSSGSNSDMIPRETDILRKYKELIIHIFFRRVLCPSSKTHYSLNELLG